MEKRGDVPGRDRSRVVRETVASYYGFFRKVTVDFLQLMRKAAIDGTKEFFAPLTGYCPRCEEEQRNRTAVRPMDGGYPDW